MTQASNTDEGRTGRLLEALCSLGSADEARAFLSDLCTPREIEDLSQRLEVATMLAGGASYLDVSHATGASRKHGGNL